MVPPFALALAVGSYLSILSIYSTLSYLHLHHHVQGAPATATWIDRGDDFAITKPVAPTILHFALTSTSTFKRRQWDPGIPKHKNGRRCDVHTSHFLLFLLTWLSHLPPSLRLTRPMPKHSKTAPIIPCYSLDACHSSSATSLRRNECRGAPHPTAVGRRTVRRGALALIQSLFQCSHPVSSRPTVPNIQ